jgi:tryptophanyl-tRNA synthetase
LIGKVPLLPGVDGRKMSKSYNNTVSLTASTEEIGSKVRLMITDPQRIRKDDPGHPEVCVVSKFHKIYSPDTQRIEEECVAGKIGCVACKKYLAENIDKVLAPYRERRKYWEVEGKVEQVLLEGAEKSRKTVAQTMNEVREAMGI